VGLCGPRYDAAAINRYLAEQVHLSSAAQDRATRKSASHLRLAS
jgi:hypothetical protein